MWLFAVVGGSARSLMKVEGIIWLKEVVDKITSKHSVDMWEVEEVMERSPGIRFVESGDKKGEDLYMALGTTESGRYLAVLFIYKNTREALILSARDMARKERKLYAKK